MRTLIILVMLFWTHKATAQLSELSQLNYPQKLKQIINSKPIAKTIAKANIPQQIPVKPIINQVINQAAQFNENDLQLINRKAFDLLMNSYQNRNRKLRPHEDTQNTNAIFANYLSYKRLLENPQNINSQDYYNAYTAKNNLELLCGRETIFMIDSLWNNFRQKGAQYAQTTNTNISNNYAWQ
ncbi:MAG: hypothetical protein LW817_05440 [Candidatus Caenarcaniphilales bacterium]|nr:hypothetical protein [Candidatus Caenarcaniphilales bacterium]